MGTYYIFIHIIYTYLFIYGLKTHLQEMLKLCTQ